MDGKYFGVMVDIDANEIHRYFEKKRIKVSKLKFEMTTQLHPTMTMVNEGDKVEMIFDPPFNAIGPF